MPNAQMVLIRIVAKDVTKTRFMQSADVFEPFKVIIDPKPVEMTATLKPEETEESVATKIRKAIDGNGGQFAVIAIICGAYSWRDPSVKVISAKLNFTKDRARKLLYGTDKAYRIIRDEIVDNSRWSIIHSIVIQRVEDGRFFADSYSVGATESQDESPWEYTEPAFTEVFPVEKVVIEYR
jgi:hypothetical protein